MRGALATHLVLLVLAAPAALQAQTEQFDGFDYVTNADNTIEIIFTYPPTSGDTTNGACIIPATINGLPVTSLGYIALTEADPTSITIPGSVTNIGVEAFEGCTRLTSITIPAGSIADLAFWGCAGLTNITILSGVTSLGSGAFANCDSLTTVTMLNGVTNIGGTAFSDCGNLTTVYFAGNAPTIGSDVFASSNATVYYCAGTTGWSEFSSNADLPVVVWNPLGSSGDVRVGLQSNQFEFSFTGPDNLPVVVEACTNLASPIWTPILTNVLSNNSFYFSEPWQTNLSGRFYRISSP
jgi:hypothetical protein